MWPTPPFCRICRPPTAHSPSWPMQTASCGLWRHADARSLRPPSPALARFHVRAALLPLRLLDLQLGMRHQAMPYDGLKCFGVRGHVRRVDRRNDDDFVANTFCIAAISPDDSEDPQATLFRLFQSADDICADIALRIA